MSLILGSNVSAKIGSYVVSGATSATLTPRYNVNFGHYLGNSTQSYTVLGDLGGELTVEGPLVEKQHLTAFLHATNPIVSGACTPANTYTASIQGSSAFGQFAGIVSGARLSAFGLNLDAQGVLRESITFLGPGMKIASTGGVSPVENPSTAKLQANVSLTFGGNYLVVTGSTESALEIKSLDIRVGIPWNISYGLADDTYDSSLMLFAPPATTNVSLDVRIPTGVLTNHLRQIQAGIPGQTMSLTVGLSQGGWTFTAVASALKTTAFSMQIAEGSEPASLRVEGSNEVIYPTSLFGLRIQ